MQFQAEITESVFFHRRSKCFYTGTLYIVDIVIDVMQFRNCQRYYCYYY